MSLLLGLVVMAFGQTSIEKEVTFIGAGGLEMKGTYSIPASNSDKQLPGVLLLPGSGPSDRNGNQPPQLITDVLKQISQKLNASGFATLRFDKRATSTYRSKFIKLNVSELGDFFAWDKFVDDAAAGMRFLASQPNVDPKRIAIIGHSEGAEIALQIGSNEAGKADEPTAIVTMGGTGRSMGPVLHDQIARLLDKQKQVDPVRKMYLDSLDKITSQVAKDGTYPAEIPGGLQALFPSYTAKLMHSYCSIDPCALAKHYQGSVLILNGGNDTQVSPERDSPLLKQALESRGEGDVEMLIIPGASHNFKATTAGNNDAFEGPVVPIALEKIKQFLTKHLRP